ncbi:DUF2501 domain-containing protein [Rosenbergiella australiborealis]|uniref:DUF2501 domain-containing protein n=1 Tax=Rosenbergiella australiborealis TaxID=1544696 RepID=A0ABS5T0P2_9GAMM|nr:DUF2501 domain-containing protein [Rosenbergiella australiborealis]MBT0725914.1 DUF2501 domain-containing protein [Rosenbergiella australiborealis]
MRFPSRSLLVLGIAVSAFTSFAHATSWQDKLSSTATDLMNSTNSGQTNTTTSSANNGLSLGTITELLGGSNKAVSAKNMSNVTGILQYCVKNNIVDNNVTSVADQLKSKLGLTQTTSQASNSQQQNSYLQGVEGLLTTGNNQKIDLKSLSDTQMGQKLKTKACNVVLNQGKKYLGM